MHADLIIAIIWAVGFVWMVIRQAASIVRTDLAVAKQEPREWWYLPDRSHGPLTLEEQIRKRYAECAINVETFERLIGDLVAMAIEAKGEDGDGRIDPWTPTSTVRELTLTRDNRLIKAELPRPMREIRDRYERTFETQRDWCPGCWGKSAFHNCGYIPPLRPRRKYGGHM